MSEQNLQNVTIAPNSEEKAAEDAIASDSEQILAKLILEIQNTPECYWLNLLQILRLFRESVTQNPAAKAGWSKVMEELKNSDNTQQSVQKIALSNLFQEWSEEDEQEQKETWEILSRSLNEGGVSIC
jgi:NurA-like 5'-3' nuclease